MKALIRLQVSSRARIRLSSLASLFSNLANLLRYRGLISSLVARELKARYRGSVLGFFWSFINPLLLLLDLLVRLHLHPPRTRPKGCSRARCSCSAASCRGPGSRSSLTEAAGSLISGGNLDQEGAASRPKCCPSSASWRTWCTSSWGCRSSIGFLIYYQAIFARPVRSHRGSRSRCSCS